MIVGENVQKYLDLITQDSFGGYAYLKDIGLEDYLHKFLLYSGFIEIVKPWEMSVNLINYGYIRHKTYNVYDSNYNYIYTGKAKGGVWGLSKQDLNAVLNTVHGDYLYITFEALDKPREGILWVCKQIPPQVQRDLIQQWQKEANLIKTNNRYTEIFVDPTSISVGVDIEVFYLEGDWDAAITVNDIITNKNTKSYRVIDTDVFVLMPQKDTWYVFNHLKGNIEGQKDTYLKANNISGVGADRIIVDYNLHYIEIKSSYKRRSIEAGRSTYIKLSTLGRRASQELIAVNFELESVVIEYAYEYELTGEVYIQIEEQLIPPPPFRLRKIHYGNSLQTNADIIIDTSIVDINLEEYPVTDITVGTSDIGLLLYVRDDILVTFELFIEEICIYELNYETEYFYENPSNTILDIVGESIIKCIPNIETLDLTFKPFGFVLTASSSLLAKNIKVTLPLEPIQINTLRLNNPVDIVLESSIQTYNWVSMDSQEITGYVESEFFPVDSTVVILPSQELIGDIELLTVVDTVYITEFSLNLTEFAYYTSLDIDYSVRPYINSDKLVIEGGSSIIARPKTILVNIKPVQFDQLLIIYPTHSTIIEFDYAVRDI